MHVFPSLPPNLCVKVYDGRLLHATDHAKQVLDREYGALIRTAHPNIVRIVAVFKENDEDGDLTSVRIVLERALPVPDGPKLQALAQAERDKRGGPAELFRYLVGRGRQPEKVAKFIMYQLLAATRHLHTMEPARIIHRDLKTENALVAGEVACSAGMVPICKLTDFGTARLIPVEQLLTHKAMMTTNQGSGQYMAPELLARATAASSSSSSSSSSAAAGARPSHASSGRTAPYDEKVDIFSLGVCLFFMVSMDYPFSTVTQANNEDVWRPASLGGAVRWEVVNALLSTAGRDLLKWMLTPYPKLRLSAAQCLAHKWFDDIRQEVKVVLADDTLLSLKRT